jgi:hypothetical protein
MFLANVIFVASGVLDHFDLRTLIFFDAVLFIAAFWIFLLIFRVYKGTRLGALSVLVMGVIWFSLADAENSLWGFQVPWYLVILFFTVTSYLLLIPRGHRNVLFTLAVLIAIAASYTISQGFLLWPVELICLVWNRPWVRRTYCECGIWISVAVLTIVLYLIGFDFESECSFAPGTGHAQSLCSTHFALHHPVATAQFFLILVGNVFPSGYWKALLAPQTHFGNEEALGTLILLVATFVVVQSFRERRTLPLPILLIAFAVLFDLLIATGRAAGGLNQALLGNRYVMPNLIMLLGIASYALAHVPSWEGAPLKRGWDCYLQWSALGVLGLSLVVQVIVATQFGLDNGPVTKRVVLNEARVAVNLDRLPPSAWACELRHTMLAFPVSRELATALPLFSEARADQLNIFQAGPYRALRSLGLPTGSWRCIPPSNSSATS